MLKVYPSVIHALLTLTDMHGYHTQFSMVTNDIDMISVVFITDKSLKLCASMSIHTTGISPASAVWLRLTGQSQRWGFSNGKRGWFLLLLYQDLL